MQEAAPGRRIRREVRRKTGCGIASRAGAGAGMSGGNGHRRSLPHLCLAALALAVAPAVALARSHIQIAGSSTVLPYAAIVAESFGENFPYRNPVVEAGGTSAGLRKFCDGLGENGIDIANASRPIRPAERAQCAANGVTQIIEIRIGHDGIVLAGDSAGADFAFTPVDWYRALAAEVVVDGRLVPNPYRRWNEVDPRLPPQDILAFVPGTKHGTREVFETRVIEQGCKDSGAAGVIAGIRGEDRVKDACTRLRSDGLSVDIDGDYTETLARIGANRDAIGVFGLAFYENNAARLRLATMSGVTPTAATIASGEYPVSRPLYLYVKAAHLGVIPGLREFVEFFVSDDVAGPGGPLAAYGLVPDPELGATQARLADGAVMD